MENKEEEKEPEMAAETAEGGGQCQAKGKGQILSCVPWVGWPIADKMEKEKKWLGVGPRGADALLHLKSRIGIGKE